MSDLEIFTYSTEQVQAWLERIGLSRDFKPRHEPGKDLEDLTKLQRASLATMPFDDAEIHYSKQHAITLDPAGLYERFVNRRLGGYCMQGNSLFEHMTRALGFSVYSTGARVKPRVNGIPSGAYFGWCHQLNIFTLSDGRRFVTDVAFGGDGPTSPMPMVNGEIFPNIGVRRTRLVQQRIGRSANSVHWIYQIQYAADADWYDVYCFTETEFLPQDFGVMSYWTSTNPASWMTTKYVGVKMIIEDGEIIGKYTIDNGTVKRNVHGNSEIIAECKTEEERLEALEKYFTLAFTDEEKAAVHDTPAYLKP